WGPGGGVKAKRPGRKERGADPGRSLFRGNSARDRPKAAARGRFSLRLQLRLLPTVALLNVGLEDEVEDLEFGLGLDQLRVGQDTLFGHLARLGILRLGARHRDLGDAAQEAGLVLRSFEGAVFDVRVIGRTALLRPPRPALGDPAVPDG